MIYEFAFEPELVASWHEPRSAHPFISQMGRGQRRVLCAFPSAAWRNLVMRAVLAEFPDRHSVDGQVAHRNIDVLLRHLNEVGTRRNGRLGAGEQWLEAATREHAVFAFGGIVVRSAAVDAPHLIAADRFGVQDFPAWSPPAHPVLRRAPELARAFAPLLRCATQVRFVDPYFDAGVIAFREPMRHYLAEAQNRRDVGGLRLQVHLSVGRLDVEQWGRLHGVRPAEAEVAATAARLEACERHLSPMLQQHVECRVFAWGEGPNQLMMHNRYVLTEVGGVAALHGLDSGRATETDDLTVLSPEQYQARWSEYCAEGTTYRLLAERRFVGA